VFVSLNDRHTTSEQCSNKAIYNSTACCIMCMEDALYTALMCFQGDHNCCYVDASGILVCIDSSDYHYCSLCVTVQLSQNLMGTLC
jgi:hypothetical protein